MALLNRVAISTALAKAIAYKQCGKDTEANTWAIELIKLLQCNEILAGQTPTQTSDSQAAFNRAIQTGRLSGHPTNKLYAGNYMFMGTKNGKDLFKHNMTREYLP